MQHLICDGEAAKPSPAALAVGCRAHVNSWIVEARMMRSADYSKPHLCRAKHFDDQRLQLNDILLRKALLACPHDPRSESTYPPDDGQVRSGDTRVSLGSFTTKFALMLFMPTRFPRTQNPPAHKLTRQNGILSHYG